MENAIKTSIMFVALFALLWSCANRGSPGGGPVDRTPPQILSTFPAVDSTMISTHLPEILIRFSERMDEGSLSRAVFISPSVEFEQSWSKGKTLSLEIRDTLLVEQTYVVSIGTDASDERSNKLSQSFQFAFSTGSRIDQGAVYGKVFGLGRNEQAHIFGFPVRDSIDQNLTEIPPLYVTQSGKNGEYSLKYLKPDTYRILAVVDQNNNLKIDANYEKVGIPFRDITVDDHNPAFNGLNFQFTKIDTTPPVLSGARAINRNYIQLRFSEPVKLDAASEFAITDSLTSDTLMILGLSGNTENQNIMDVFTENMDSLAYYKVTFNSLSDTNGTINHLPMQLSFAPKNNSDTTGFTLSEFIPADSSINFSPNGVVSFEFTTPANWESVFRNFKMFSTDSTDIPGHWEIESARKALFVPAVSLIPDSSYIARINQGGIENLWGLTLEDSLVSHYFTVVSSRELGEISGMIRGFGRQKGIIRLTVNSIERKNIISETEPDSSGSYIFRHLPEGKYKIHGFLDLDANKTYSPGNLFPYQFAEPFFVSDDTLKVRKRWETQGNEIILPELE